MLTSRFGLPTREQQVAEEASTLSSVGLALVVMSVLAISCDAYNNSDALVTALSYIDKILGYLFIIEAAIKIVGLGLSYFAGPSNLLDISVVIIFILTQAITSGSSKTLSILR